MEFSWVLEHDTAYDIVDNRHDKGYKYLLQIKRIFVQLLRSFVDQGWVLKDTEKNLVQRKDFKLPVIVPCVLYNGKDNWTVCRSFRETLDAHELFDEYILDFKYILFDVKRYDNGVQEGIREGIKEGKINAILELLQDIGDIPEEVINVVRAQDNIAILGKWLKIAAKADKIEEFVAKIKGTN